MENSIQTRKINFDADRYEKSFLLFFAGLLVGIGLMGWASKTFGGVTFATLVIGAIIIYFIPHYYHYLWRKRN